MEDILEKTIGYSDCEYLSQLEVLHKVMFHKVKKKSGRGRNIVYYEEYKWTGEDNDEVRQRIKNSIKYYTDRCLSLEDTNGES
jgi:hypothetical protein